MANRTLRRKQNEDRSNGIGDTITNTGVTDEPAIEPEPEPDVDRIADEDDREPIIESDKSKRIGVIEIDPGELSSFIASGSGKRSGTDTGSDTGSGKRERKQRGPNKRKKEAPQNVEAIVTMVHTWASVLLKTPELMLDSTEVKTLSDSYSTFCEYHEVPILTPKRMSEVNLIATALMVYGTRYAAWRSRKRNESKPHVVQPMQQSQNIPHRIML